MTLTPLRTAPTADATAPEAQPVPDVLTLEDALTLRRVTDHAWQICDTRQKPNSPSYLLGFVETVGDGVEVMQLGDKFIWTSFATMRAALNHVCATADDTAKQRAAGNLAWIN